MQCHLETDSSLVSHSILRYSAGPFSYQPGRPLGDFRLFLEKAGGTADFQIAQGAYRFRQSACYIKTRGAFQCTTCHNPHQPDSTRDFTAVCRNCHNPAAAKAADTRRHFELTNCVTCHMPKRRTEDAVHVVMTDHRIERPRPGADLLAQIPPEREIGAPYHGELRLYYPSLNSKSPDDALLEAVAKVRERCNLSADLARLLAAINQVHPPRAEYYVDAADGLRANGERAKAIEYYVEAVRRQPDSPAILRMLATALIESGAAARATAIVDRCLRVAPSGATCWQLMARASLLAGQSVRARACFEKAIALDSENAEFHHEFALMLVASGERARAESEFRITIRIQPNIAEAHANLANLLSWKPDFAAAIFHYREALRIRPAFGQAHFGYAAVLAQAGRWEEAQGRGGSGRTL